MDERCAWSSGDARARAGLAHGAMCVSTIYRVSLVSVEGGGESVRARCADGREVRMAERRSEAPCGTSTRRDVSGAMRVFSGALLSHGFHLCAVGHFSFVRVCFGIGRHC